MGKIHQIFIGCPYARSIRRHYDKSKLELEKETPLNVILADTVALTSTDYLFEWRSRGASSTSARGRRSSMANSTGDGASGCLSRSSASKASDPSVSSLSGDRANITRYPYRHGQDPRRKIDYVVLGRSVPKPNRNLILLLDVARSARIFSTK